MQSFTKKTAVRRKGESQRISKKKIKPAAIKNKKTANKISNKTNIKNKKESWLIFYIVFSIFLFIAVCIGYFYHFLNMQVVAKDVNLLIKNGSSIESITNTLYNKQVIKHKFPFKMIARIYSIAGYYLQAGEYFFDRGMRTSEVIAAMIYGSIIEYKITFIEGHSTYDFIQKINNTKTLKGNKLDADQYGEGLLLASTYKYNYNTTKRGIAIRMNRLLQHVLRKEWDSREEGLPLNTPYEALILASIIEKETILTDEMPKIASVYINRLKKGMSLQACPTVIYSITAGRKNFGRNVKYEDLKVVSPHNTYLNKGLPPTPICNPSIEAIKATLHPAKTNYLYFVSNGQRGHMFSVSYGEHLYHSANYKKLRAQAEKIN